MWEYRDRILKQTESMSEDKWLSLYAHEFNLMEENPTCKRCGVPYMGQKHVVRPTARIPTVEDVCPAKTQNYRENVVSSDEDIALKDTKDTKKATRSHKT